MRAAFAPEIGGPKLWVSTLGGAPRTATKLYLPQYLLFSDPLYSTAIHTDKYALIDEKKEKPNSGCTCRLAHKRRLVLQFKREKAAESAADQRKSPNALNDAGYSFPSCGGRANGII